MPRSLTGCPPWPPPVCRTLPVVAHSPAPPLRYSVCLWERACPGSRGGIMQPLSSWVWLVAWSLTCSGLIRVTAGVPVCFLARAESCGTCGWASVAHASVCRWARGWLRVLAAGHSAVTGVGVRTSVESCLQTRAAYRGGAAGWCGSSVRPALRTRRPAPRSDGSVSPPSPQRPGPRSPPLLVPRPLH